MSRLRRKMGRLAAGVLALAALEGMGTALAQQMPAMPVTVANPVSRKITESIEFTGRFQAWPQVNITSRVTGYLDKSSFVEGSLVKEGDVLFSIDPRPFQAAVDQAAAQVKITQTRIDLTKANLARAEALKKTGNVTDATYQANLQAYQEAAASIDSANAALATAKLDLNYATIAAPISGRITRQLVSRGNLVVANSTSPLVSIVAVDPIYFYFDLDEASYLAYQRASKRKVDAGGTEPGLTAEIGLSDEKAFSHKGALDYLAPQVDAQTGTVTARAKVANADGFLTSGLFGRIRITIGEPYQALVVPDVAVGQSAQGRYVIVVGADKIANIRPVELGPKFGSFRVIKSGLKAEDQVLINGQMRARPGGEVVPQPTKLDVPETLVPDPIFAAVVSIVTVVIGLVSYVGLPIAQFPQIAPPTVVINATYPGANAQTIAETVAAPLEQSINGVEGMIYQTSQATNDGSLQITVTFATGTDLDIAQVQVQNRVSSAEPRLPAEVRALGITVNKSSSDFLLIVTLYSPDNSLNDYGISDYAILNVNDILARVDGVGSTFAFGLREPSLRVWLDPNRLASFDLTAGEVVQALREQNVQVSGGTLGAQPSPSNTTSEITVTTLGRFQDAEQFRNVIVKSTSDGRLLKLRDVARVEVGAKQYSSNLYLDGQSTVGIAVLQRPGSNALATADRVKAKMDDLAKAFPPGLKYSIVYNPTEFVSASIEAVYETFFEAIVLVVIVVFVFLQSWRAAIIPIIAIPVSIIGTFAVMAGLGFSLNMLTLFGLILAVGIVVDDAIVVVENVERNIHDGMTPNRAAHVTMDEVGRAVIAIALVLCAVFVPTAFIPGISGLFYQQFAVTIAAATVISAFNSLTLSPALAALLLKPHDADHKSRFFLFRWLRGAGDAFNRGFDRLSRGYGGTVGFAARHKLLFLLIYAGLLFATWHVYTRVPTGFVPDSDQGYAIVVVQLPDGASLERTDAVVRKAQQIAAGSPGVAHVIGVAGFSGATFTAASNAATIFVPFKPFDERLKEGLSAQAIVGELQKRVFAIEEGFVFVIPPPTIQGLGTGAGFKMQVQDRGGVGPEALMQAANALIGKANQTPGLTQVYTTLSNNGPQLFVNVDRVKARMLNVPIGNIFEAMQVYVGSAYVNDFTRLGRAFQVNAQAEGRERLNKEDLVRLKVRSTTGALVPLGSLISFEERTGPDTVMRHNLYPAIYISGSGLPGVSSTTALDLMEKAAAEVLPPGVGYEWTEIAFQERSVGNTIYFVFGIAVLFVFLFLAAQYESWSLPLAIILIVPLSILAALLGGMARGLPLFGGWWFKVMDNNIMTQISFVMLIGLAAKNAILIVEFARQREDHGDTPWQAVVEACRLRLRPILMTSFAFILGAVPLMIATGPGSELRQAIGTAVVFGMSGVTFLGLFLTPVFYVTLRLIVRMVFREKPKPSTVIPATMNEPEGS